MMNTGQLFNRAARVFGATAVLMTLAACVDVDMAIEVLDTENARGTMTMSMDRNFYEMDQAQGAWNFCAENDELTVGETLVVCVSSAEGPFRDVIDANDGEPAPTIVDLGDGTVRVSLPTQEIMAELGGGIPSPQALPQMASMFEGKMFTITVSGNQIVDTNMVLATDEKSASLTILIVDLIDGTAEVPEESFAVVKLN